MKTIISVLTLVVSLLTVQNVQASSIISTCANAYGTVVYQGLGGATLQITEENYVAGKWVSEKHTYTREEFEATTTLKLNVHEEKGKGFQDDYSVVKMTFKKKDGGELAGSVGDGSRTEIMLCNLSKSWM